MRTFLTLRSSGLELLRALERWRLLRPGRGTFLVGDMDYLDKMATDVDEMIRGEAVGGPTGGGGRFPGFRIQQEESFCSTPAPRRKGAGGDRAKGPLGREAADTGPRRRELSADTGLAEALFELATVNDEEWGGVYAQDMRCCCERPVRRVRAYHSGVSITGSGDRGSPSI